MRGAAADLLGTAGFRTRNRAIGAALGLLLLTLTVNLRYLSGASVIPAEEHFRLGEHLHSTGILSINDTPAFFRPPGFPVFVAVVLQLRDALSPGLDGSRAVALAHGCLLSLGALAVFLFTSRFCTVPVAFAVGALYAFHPLNLVLARALTYSTLHIVLVTVATIAVTWALRNQRRRLLWALAAGVFWGAATLVRPVSLLLPPFVLLLARWDGGKGSWRGALRFSGLFTLGMALVIAPYTVRNYRLSHRLIVVNAQEGFQFWGLSATKNPGGDFTEWAALWGEQGLPIFARVSGGAAYTTDALYENPVAFNDAFRAEAGRNIRRHPGRFAVNILRNFHLFNTDSTGWWFDYINYVRDGGEWRTRVGPAKVFSVALLLLGLAGVVRGLRDGVTHARVVATIYSTFCVAHCLGFLLARYNYVRLPLVLLAVPLVLPCREKPTVSAALAFLVAVLAATASVLEL